MQIPVLIEPIAGNGYRARGMEPLALCAEGATRDEAVANLRTEIQTRLKNGAEVVPLDIGSEPHPWMQFAGMFKDDPWIDEWKQSIENYRKKVEDNPDAL